MKAIFFIGLSGVGKSTLMRSLAMQFPDRFIMPQRWTTRQPKRGDFDDEVHCINEQDFDDLLLNQRLLFVMQHNALQPNSTRSSYPKTVLELPQTPLLFCSIFSLDQVQLLRQQFPNVLCLHIKAQWQDGLRLRGSKTNSARTKLNQDLAHLFTTEALEGAVDFHFEHGYEGSTACSIQLATRISEYLAKTNSYTSTLKKRSIQGIQAGNHLGMLGFYWISGNVRLSHQSLGFPLRDALLYNGKVQRGDLVLGRLLASPQKPLSVWDWQQTAITLYQPAFVIVPAGDRESSTHVNGGIPQGGLATHVKDQPLCHWLAGESGLIGILESEGVASNDLSEKSSQFQALAYLAFPHGHSSAHTAINVSHLALQPIAKSLTKPIIAIGATSAEAGKTTLIESLVKHLSDSIKIGVIKATGTGGTVDSRRHKQAGAYSTFDQVDSGCITTYLPAADFNEFISPALLACEDADVDLIMVELGGDLPWANNNIYLNHPLVKDHMKHLFVICNDALAYYGATHWIQTLCPFLNPTQLSMITSPFRNPKGFMDRRRVLGGPPFIAYHDIPAMIALITQILNESHLYDFETSSPQELQIDASAGQFTILEKFWQNEAVVQGLVTSHFDTIFDEMNFKLDGADCAINEPKTSTLDLQLRKLHHISKNADVSDHHLVLGHGARQLLLAASYALRKQASHPLSFHSTAPFYPVYGRLCTVNPSLGEWIGSAFDWDGGVSKRSLVQKEHQLDECKAIKIHCIPNNPDGAFPNSQALEAMKTSSCILDLSYYWPHFWGDHSCSALSHDILLFSLSKLTGHGGLRFGWAWIKDQQIAKDMREYIRHDTIGVSRRVLRHAHHLLDLLLRDEGSLLHKQERYIKKIIQDRSMQIQDLLNQIGWSVYQENKSPWCYVWLRDPQQDIRTYLSTHGVLTYPGEKMGKPGYLRLNLLLSKEDFNRLLKVLAGTKIV